MKFLHITLCLAAALGTWFTRVDAVTTPSHPVIDWPKTFEGQPLEAVESHDQDLRIFERGAGTVGRFRQGDRLVILRQLDEVHADLHTARTCFRGSGYRVTPLPALDVGGARWGRFQAEREGSWVVRERVVSASGESFADLSAWYWSATLGLTTGPWRGELVVEPAVDD